MYTLELQSKLIHSQMLRLDNILFRSHIFLSFIFYSLSLIKQVQIKPLCECAL